MKIKKSLLTIVLGLTLSGAISISSMAATNNSWVYIGPVFHSNGTIYCKYVKAGGFTALRLGYPNCPYTIYNVR